MRVSSTMKADKKEPESKILYPCIPKPSMKKHSAFDEDDDDDDDDNDKGMTVTTPRPPVPVLMIITATIVMIMALVWRQQQPQKPQQGVDGTRPKPPIQNEAMSPSSHSTGQPSAWWWSSSSWATTQQHLDHMTSRLALEFGTGKIHWDQVLSPLFPANHEELLAQWGIHNYNHLHEDPSSRNQPQDPDNNAPQHNKDEQPEEYINYSPTPPEHHHQQEEPHHEEDGWSWILTREQHDEESLHN